MTGTEFNAKRRQSRRDANGFTKKDLEARKNFIFDINGNPVERRCTKCTETKPLDAFYDEKNGYFGKMSKCKTCFKVIMDRRKEYNIKNRIIVEKKVCPNCQKEKGISEFYTDIKAPDGKTIKCIDCIKEYHKQHYIDNSEEICEKRKQYSKTPQGRKTIARWEKENGWRRPLYRAKPAHKARQKKWWTENHEKAKAYKAKRIATPKGALDERMARTIRRGLKNGSNGERWDELVPYSLDALYDSLNKTMPNEHTWQDFQNGDLHIDHKIPLVAFPYSTIDNINFLKAWAIDNLQLLPAVENLKKWAKVETPFQQYLGFRWR